MSDSDKDRRDRVMRALAQRLMDEGKVIEGGWQIFRLMALSPQLAGRELDLFREAFFSGAQHLFGSIMSALEDGVMETENDMKRMNNIAAELEAFAQVLKLKYGRARGSA